MPHLCSTEEWIQDSVCEAYTLPVSYTPQSSALISCLFLLLLWYVTHIHVCSCVSRGPRVTFYVWLYHLPSYFCDADSYWTLKLAFVCQLTWEFPDSACCPHHIPSAEVTGMWSHTQVLVWVPRILTQVPPPLYNTHSYLLGHFPSLWLFLFF